MLVLYLVIALLDKQQETYPNFSGSLLDYFLNKTKCNFETEFRILGISPKNIRGLIGTKSYFYDLKLRNFFKIFEVSSPRLSLLLLFCCYYYYLQCGK